MQHIADLPGPDQPGHALARGDGLVQAGIVLET